MSNPNLHINSDLAQTPIDNAYQFNSFSPFIMNGGLNLRFSPVCIFCSCKNTINLVNDGSFKQCMGCKKQFKANNINLFNEYNPRNFPPYITKN